MPKKQFPPNLSTWLIRGGIVLFVLLGLWISRHHLVAALDVLRNREAVAAYLEPLGIWGPLLYVFLLLLQVITVFVPGHALLIAGGYLYGFWGGLTLSVVAVVLASQLAFLIARRGGQPLVDRIVPAKVLDHWNQLIKKQGFIFFLTLYLFPIIPGNFTNYIAGLSKISFVLFFLANLLGRLPGLILITLIGSHGLELTWRQWGIILPIALVVIIGGRYLSAKVERRLQASA
jgi:uncharacterized membrane protein YdjX (TVP38/TMEM64 family)